MSFSGGIHFFKIGFFDASVVCFSRFSSLMQICLSAGLLSRFLHMIFQDNYFSFFIDASKFKDLLARPVEKSVHFSRFWPSGFSCCV